MLIPAITRSTSHDLHAVVGQLVHEAGACLLLATLAKLLLAALANKLRAAFANLLVVALATVAHSCRPSARIRREVSAIRVNRQGVKQSNARIVFSIVAARIVGY